MQEIYQELEKIVSRARADSRVLARLSSERKNRALCAMAASLRTHAEAILAENAEDLKAGKQSGLSAAMLDRLALSAERIEGMARGIEKLVALPDPIGQSEGWKHANGMKITKTRVPLGVIGIIYEARPNVTSDAACLCFKSGNAVILRGGKEALNTNRAVLSALRAALREEGLPGGVIHLIESADRAYTNALLTLQDGVDAVIPRGGAGLIRFVKENARVPVIETGAGNCHLYVHEDADLAVAEDVLVNAKVSRPSVCNAVEHLLVHEKVAAEFLPRAAKALSAFGVTLRGCETCVKLCDAFSPVTEDDYATEYNDLVLSARVVESEREAIAHIDRYGTRHSETIITNSFDAAHEFQNEVDAACVYVNASSRFTDGEEFGFGAEIGISTQKLHARGPMGLAELTTSKYLITGWGQTRGTPPKKD
ncbi:MAG: glutamate-5-semialdehyde dehydrogenase [Clostridia bacterium]|nr:glutamate-5-semialdehyde dehydrogenase [Clostridia bacterium]